MKYIIANWKSNKLLNEALEWVSVVGPKLSRKEGVVVVVCPTNSALEHVKKAVQAGNFALQVGAQNLSPFSFGSYTGEEAGEILKPYADYSIIGHSERRKYFSETDEMIGEKVKRAREVGLEPVLCVQDANTPVAENSKIVAYEPVFAIGTGNADTPENANKTASEIKQKHPDVEVLYGGSVTSENAKAFLEQQAISGLLIGKASLDAEEFIKIVEIAQSL